MFSWYVLLVGSYGLMTFSSISEEISKYRGESMNEWENTNTERKHKIRNQNEKQLGSTICGSKPPSIKCFSATICGRKMFWHSQELLECLKGCQIRTKMLTVNVLCRGMCTSPFRSNWRWLLVQPAKILPNELTKLVIWEELMHPVHLHRHGPRHPTRLWSLPIRFVGGDCALDAALWNSWNANQSVKEHKQKHVTWRVINKQNDEPSLETAVGTKVHTMNTPLQVMQETCNTASSQAAM